MLSEIRKARPLIIEIVSESSNKFNENKTSLHNKPDSSLNFNDA